MPRQRFEDIFPSGTGLDIRGLLGQQAGFVGGLGSVPLSGEFDPALGELLRTGAPVSTRGAEGAASSAATRAWRDISRQINEQMIAGGKSGSSAQTTRLAEAGGDIVSRLQEHIANLQYGAGEAAAGRRVSALNPALEQGRLGLSAKTAQAGAGIDLLRLLKTMAPTGVPELPGSRSTAQIYGRPRPGGGPAGVSHSTKVRQGNFGAGNFLNLLTKAHQVQNRWVGSGIGGPRFTASENALRSLLDPTVMGQFAAAGGYPGLAQASLEAGKIGTEGFKASQAGSSAAAGAAAPLLAQAQQQNFLAQIMEQWGPYFAQFLGKG